MNVKSSPLPLTLSDVSLEANGKPLLAAINAVIEPGGPVVLLGPNGAGKTLLLRLCHGLIKPTAGAIEWAWSDPRRIRAAQAFVFQKPVLLRRSAAANIDFALKQRGFARADIVRRRDAALERAGLATIAERPARILSGGEQQRLALARAWALEPSVLFLDEPSANLDPAATREIEKLIDAISTEGTTVIMTTHDLGQARRLARLVGFMHKGYMLEYRPAADFFAAPATREAAAFMAGELLW